MSKPLYSFCHIPKTAGTTFEGILRHNLNKKYFRITEYKYPFGSWYEEKRNIIAIGGHYDWSFPDDCGLFADRQIIHFVFLRNPIERALSFLYFCNPSFHKNPIDFFVNKNSGDWKYRSNTAVKFLAGIDREPNQFHFEVAKNRLEKSNVGFQETFDQDLLRFKKEYPGIFKFIKYEYKNKGKFAKRTSEALLQQIKNVNSWDIELYEYAKSRGKNDG